MNDTFFENMLVMEAGRSVGGRVEQEVGEVGKKHLKCDHAADFRKSNSNPKLDFKPKSIFLIKLNRIFTNSKFKYLN